MACVFEYHVKGKRGDWLKIALKELKDNAYTDAHNLTWEKVELLKKTVEALKVGGARLDPKDMMNALMNCSFLEVPSGEDIKEMEITEDHIKRKFGNNDIVLAMELVLEPQI